MSASIPTVLSTLFVVTTMSAPTASAQNLSGPLQLQACIAAGNSYDECVVDPTWEPGNGDLVPGPDGDEYPDLRKSPAQCQREAQAAFDASARAEAECLQAVRRACYRPWLGDYDPACVETYSNQCLDLRLARNELISAWWGDCLNGDEGPAPFLD